jgi:DNA-directed RNA polymerase specialized sigma24 family protein
VCPHGLWHDDVAAAAALAAWLHPDQPSAPWRAGIDELRRLTGWHRGRGEARLVAGGEPDRAVCDDHPGDLLDALDPLARRVVVAVAAGWRRREVAEALGVAPTVVSRILARARRVI